MSYHVEIKSTARNVPAHLLQRVPSQDCTVEHNAYVYQVPNPEESAIKSPDYRSQLESTNNHQGFDVNRLKEATPQVFAASKEIRQYSQMLGVTVPVLLTNFLKYTSRVNVLANVQNFIVYLRNWADLDLRIAGSKLKTNQEAKEALLMRLQNFSQEGETYEDDKPVKILTKTWVHGGCTYYNVLRPVVSPGIFESQQRSL